MSCTRYIPLHGIHCLTLLESQNAIVWVQVLTAVTINVTVFWNVTPCSLVESYRCAAGLRNSPTLKNEIADFLDTPVTVQLHGVKRQKSGTSAESNVRRNPPNTVCLIQNVTQQNYLSDRVKNAFRCDFWTSFAACTKLTAKIMNRVGSVLLSELRRSDITSQSLLWQLQSARKTNSLMTQS